MKVLESGICRGVEGGGKSLLALYDDVHEHRNEGKCVKRTIHCARKLVHRSSNGT